MAIGGKGQGFARWSVEFYESPGEGSPVEAFLESLPFPYSSQISGRLRELRTQLGKMHLRILYCATPRRKFLLLQGFVKRTARTPTSAIDLAIRRMEEYLQGSG